MSANHLVRVGAMGLVGRFSSAESVRYGRGMRVVTRTGRGLELGEILSAEADDVISLSQDGTIIRRMTVEDQLLEARLLRNREEALGACERLIAERGIEATLLDVECLFDGQNLLFYFLGDVPPELSALTLELAETYDARVEMRKFTETLLTGCGPGCGTEEAAGFGCGTCSSCAVSGACGTSRRVGQG